MLRRYCKPARCEKPIFTLIELLVVIAIISLLMTILLPALKRAKETAKRSYCVNNQKQLTVAMFDYAGNYNDAIARKDYARTNGSWSGFCMSIANDRPISDPKKVVRHGSWMIDSTLNIESYFCPSYVDHQANWRSLSTRLQQSKVPNVVKMFRTGGLKGSFYPEAIWPTSYAFNPALIQDNYYLYSPLPKRFYKVSDLRSNIPVLCDARLGIVNGSQQLWIQYHDAQGFNIAAGDGSVRWKSAGEIINSGIETYRSGWRTWDTDKWLHYDGLTKWPHPPGIFYNSFEQSLWGENPMNYNVEFWMGLAKALQ